MGEAAVGRRALQRALQEIARRPGEGRKIHVFGVVLTVRIASMDTGGDFAIWEEESPPLCGPPRHIHHYVDEAFQIRAPSRNVAMPRSAAAAQIRSTSS